MPDAISPLPASKTQNYPFPTKRTVSAAIDFIHGKIQRNHLASSLIVLLAMNVFASCHTQHSKTVRNTESAHLSSQDSLLGLQFPVLEHLITQKELLLKHSQRSQRVLVPDGKAMEGLFNSGTVDLVFDRIGSEPQDLYGHLENTGPEERISFIIWSIPDKALDRLVPGKTYRVHWIETVTNTEPFDDDKYRNFVAYRVDEK